MKPAPETGKAVHLLVELADLRPHLGQFVSHSLEGFLILLGTHGVLLQQHRVAQLALEPSGLGELGLEFGLVLEDLERAECLQIVFLERFILRFIAGSSRKADRASRKHCQSDHESRVCGQSRWFASLSGCVFERW